MRIGSGEFLLGDCFEHMATLPDASVDMILCDLPYGTTACKWDAVLPFEVLWKEYWRIAKPNAAVVLTASQPFTTALIHSQLNNFRYELIWEKERPSNPLLARKQIMKYHENICVFYKQQPTFHPQLRKRDEANKRKNKPRVFETEVIGGGPKYEDMNQSGNADFIKPKSVLSFSMQRGLHPTQKPVALFEYLIRTYTDAGQVVLDNTAGSGTTAIAAENAGRKWICIERDPDYYAKAVERVRRHVNEDLL